MDVPTLMHNLREEVSCSVCIHLYKEPKQLPCLHIFCLECLNGLARTNARHGKIKCPLCQIEVAVPDSGTMETLPDCFYLKNLLDILAIKECNTSKVTCGNCDNKSDEASYCFHCCKFWCKECLNAHSMLRENKEHRVLALKDFQDEDFEDVIKRPAFCPKELHEKAVFKFYCKACEVPACQTCVTLEHGKHDVEHLEITARAVRDSIASKLEDAKKSSNTVSSFIRILEEQNRLLESHSQIIKQQIQKTVKTLIQTLQQQERELITEVETQTKEAQENLMKDKAGFRDQLRKIEETVSQVNRLVERSTGAELVRTRTTVEELFLELHEPQEMPSSFDSKIIKTVFLENQELCETLRKTRLGRMAETTTEVNQCSLEGFEDATAGLESQFKVVTRNCEGQQCYCPGDNVAVEIVSAQGGKAAVETRIVDLTDGSYAVSFIPAEAGQHVVTFQVNGQKPAEIPTIHIKERSFKPVRFIGQKGVDNKKLNCPWGVTVNRNDIFVTDMENNRILVFTEKGQFLRSFGQHLVDMPTGISVDNEGRIFVVNRGNNKILLFNQNEEYVTTVNDDVELKSPRGISLDLQGNIVVCSSESKCVKVLSVDGTFRRTIGLGKIEEPFDCLCHEDKVYVSDRAGNAIKVFNVDGEFLYKFGKRGTGKGEVQRPTGLGIDKVGHLLVCCEKTQRVQIYKLDGTYVTSFGESGRCLGQFNLPNSASVLTDGRIVIADFDNKLLQLFE